MEKEEEGTMKELESDADEICSREHLQFHAGCSIFPRGFEHDGRLIDEIPARFTSRMLKTVEVDLLDYLVLSKNDRWDIGSKAAQLRFPIAAGLVYQPAKVVSMVHSSLRSGFAELSEEERSKETLARGLNSWIVNWVRDFNCDATPSNLGELFAFITVYAMWELHYGILSLMLSDDPLLVVKKRLQACCVSHCFETKTQMVIHPFVGPERYVCKMHIGLLAEYKPFKDASDETLVKLQGALAHLPSAESLSEVNEVWAEAQVQNRIARNLLRRKIVNPKSEEAAPAEACPAEQEPQV